ncbi:MarR family winged helix-turn-helix transcriptional regulator [Micromonospora craterilacus]|uniref:MarR family winged helix-turn-helix transcriptional regulator n=1 Tax=Micromonospora craterilacus TaxID=1655439 RepID=UPI001F449249|nr:MarR family transcriptional regulator [Micromonospora craterilacus]
MRAYLERTVLREAGLTWTTYDVLVLVCARDVAEPPVIAAEAGVARATLTNALALLGDRGLVRREQHEHDLRRVVVRPTQAGSSLAGMLRRQVGARRAELFRSAAIPSEDDLAAALGALADQIKPGVGPAGNGRAR